MAEFRGLQDKHERGASQMARDTRPLGERVAEFLANPDVVTIILVISIGVAFFQPAFADVVFLVCTIIFFFAYFRRNTLPMKLPMVSGAKDFNDCIPGTNTPRCAKGITFIGNEHNTKKELWVTNDDMRTHVLIFGSTGSGKTETLVSIAFNSLCQGSGFIYVDGKGDNSLFAKVFSMVRHMGRDDDLLLVNYMTGARDIIGPQKTRLSNTMNPFALGSSSMLAQLVISLMPDSGGGGGDGDMWKGRAMVFVEALMKVLTAMRDEGHILLDANSIRNYFQLEKLEQISVDKRFPINDTESVPLDSLPPTIIEPIQNYVTNLPGYNKGKKGNQSSEVREQHGFITMQLTRVFGSLADTYGHIMRINLAEVDFKDVVLNRRILVVLLPALEKSPEELSNLGKVIIASLKAMMAAGLGDEVEGTYRDVIERKPTASPTPYVCIMDEYGYYAVKGFAVVPAQARSLGFSAIFAGQDLPAFQKAGKEEAASIGANTNVKICMKLEDPTETWEFFNKTAGETYATSVQSFQSQAGSLTTNYMDARSATVEKRQRIDLLDLKDQREGDMHVFYRSKVIRARAFYANPKPVKELQVNQFMMVERPNDQTLYDTDRRLRRFYQIFNDAHFTMPIGEPVGDINVVASAIEHFNSLTGVEKGVGAIVKILESELSRRKEVDEGATEGASEESMGSEIHAFTPTNVPAVSEEVVPAEQMESFKEPLISKSRFTDAVVRIERLAGKTEKEASAIAQDLIKEITQVTHYPPSVNFNPDPEGLKKSIDSVLRTLAGPSYESIVGVDASGSAESPVEEE